MKKMVAMVTGASRGIGKAIAERLAAEGYDLIITCSKSREDLELEAKHLAGTYGVAVDARVVDMGDAGAVETLFSDITKLDVLINNAGISYVGLLSDMTVEEWKHVMAVNLDSMFYTSRAAIPLMLREHSGRIVNVSSVWGNVGASMEVAYSASKGGVNSFTKALAKELAPSKIAVNAIACGMIDTRMNDCFSPEEKKSICDEIPADRMGTPEEVAQAVWSLLRMPEYLTGQILTMDGGWS